MSMFGKPLAIGACVAIAALLGLAGLQTLRLADERAAHAKTVAQLERERGDWQRESRKAVEAALAEGNRRTAVAQKESQDARKKAQTLGTDLAAARAAGERLRGALAAATARANTASQPAASAVGSPPKGIDSLFDDLFREMEELGREMAAEADRRGIAGQACESIYDAMSNR